jgi:hypothetical protein
MKSVVCAALLLLAMPALADRTNFSCELKSIGESFSFKIDDLGSKDASLVHSDPNDEYSAIFSSKSKDSTIKALIGSLDGQGGDLRIQPDGIALIGDGDGIDMATVGLYKDSGFKKGFVRWDFSGETGYSLISCDLQ